MIFGLFDFVMFVYHFGPVTFLVLLTRFPGSGIVDPLSRFWLSFHPLSRFPQGGKA
jgi:hypothetical protein